MRRLCCLLVLTFALVSSALLADEGSLPLGHHRAAVAPIQDYSRLCSLLGIDEKTGRIDLKGDEFVQLSKDKTSGKVHAQGAADYLAIVKGVAALIEAGGPKTVQSLGYAAVMELGPRADLHAVDALLKTFTPDGVTIRAHKVIGSPKKSRFFLLFQSNKAKDHFNGLLSGAIAYHAALASRK